MYERLRVMYREGRLSETQLQAAVAKGWVTPEQAETIRADQDSPT